jgi:cell division protein FtsL
VDNLKYYNDSLAYDFEMFMPRSAEPVRKDNIIKLPQTKQQTRAKKHAVKRVSASAFAVMTAVFVLAAMCGNIFLRLQINEVNSKINDVKTEINELESQKTALEVELERVVSYSNIELEAAEIGMQKMDKNQVKYIRVNDENTAVTKNGETIITNN